MKKKVAIILIIVAVGFYWLWPLARLWFQLNSATGKIDSVDLSIEPPVIEAVYVVPFFVGVGYSEFDKSNEMFKLDNSKSTLVITGRNFQSLFDAFTGTKQETSKVIINGREFFPVYRDVFQDDFITIDVENPFLFSQTDKQIQISLIRANTSSNSITFTNVEMQRQIDLAKSTSPSVIAAFPTDYYSPSMVSMVFILSGLPDIEKVYTNESKKNCSLKLDNQLQNCDRFYSYGGASGVNPNILIQHGFSADTQNHRVDVSFHGGAVSDPYLFNIASFLEYGANRKRLYDLSNLNHQSLGSVRGNNFQGIGFQDKNSSFLGIGINIFLTFILALLCRPWKYNTIFRWGITFIMPVILQALVVAGTSYWFAYSITVEHSNPLALLVAGSMFLTSVTYPVIEAAAVTFLLAYAVKTLRT